MKKTLIIGSLFLASQAFADPVCLTNYSHTHCKKGTILAFSQNGSVSTDETTVERDVAVNGSLVAKQSIFKNLSVNGTTYLAHCQITGETSINGSLEAEKSTFSSLALNGDAKLNQVTFKGNVQINGSLKAKESTFKYPITIRSLKVAFMNSHLKSLTVKKETEFSLFSFKKKKPDEETEVYLLGKTIVEGDITFKKGVGKVFKSKEAIIKGTVINGEVVEITQKKLDKDA